MSLSLNLSAIPSPLREQAHRIFNSKSSNPKKIYRMLPKLLEYRDVISVQNHTRYRRLIREACRQVYKSKKLSRTACKLLLSSYFNPRDYDQLDALIDRQPERFFYKCRFFRKIVHLVKSKTVDNEQVSLNTLILLSRSHNVQWLFLLFKSRKRIERLDVLNRSVAFIEQQSLTKRCGDIVAMLFSMNKKERNQVFEIPEELIAGERVTDTIDIVELLVNQKENSPQEQASRVSNA